MVRGVPQSALPVGHVTLGLVDRGAVWAERLRQPAIELPVALLFPVVGGIAVGLGDKDSHAIGEQDGLLEGSQVAYQPRCEHGDCHEAHAYVPSQADCGGQIGPTKHGESDQRKGQKQLGPGEGTQPADGA